MILEKLGEMSTICKLNKRRIILVRTYKEDHVYILLNKFHAWTMTQHPLYVYFKSLRFNKRFHHQSG